MTTSTEVPIHYFDIVRFTPEPELFYAPPAFAGRVIKFPDSHTKNRVGTARELEIELLPDPQTHEFSRVYRFRRPLRFTIDQFGRLTMHIPPGEPADFAMKQYLFSFVSRYVPNKVPWRPT